MGLVAFIVGVEDSGAFVVALIAQTIFGTAVLMGLEHAPLETVADLAQSFGQRETASSVHLHGT